MVGHLFVCSNIAPFLSFLHCVSVVGCFSVVPYGSFVPNVSVVPCVSVILHVSVVPHVSDFWLYIVFQLYTSCFSCSTSSFSVSPNFFSCTKFCFSCTICATTVLPNILSSYLPLIVVMIAVPILYWQALKAGELDCRSL